VTEVDKWLTTGVNGIMFDNYTEPQSPFVDHAHAIGLNVAVGGNVTDGVVVGDYIVPDTTWKYTNGAMVWYVNINIGSTRLQSNLTPTPESYRIGTTPVPVVKAKPTQKPVQEVKNKDCGSHKNGELWCGGNEVWYCFGGLEQRVVDCAAMNQACRDGACYSK